MSNPRKIATLYFDHIDKPRFKKDPLQYAYEMKYGGGHAFISPDEIVEVHLRHDNNCVLLQYDIPEDEQEKIGKVFEITNPERAYSDAPNTYLSATSDVSHCDMLKFEYFAGYWEYTKIPLETNSEEDSYSDSDINKVSSVFVPYNIESKQEFLKNKNEEYRRLLTNLHNMESRQQEIQKNLRTDRIMQGAGTVLTIGLAVFAPFDVALPCSSLMVAGIFYLQTEISRLKENDFYWNKHKSQFLSSHSIFSRCFPKEEPKFILEDEISGLEKTAACLRRGNT
jgi:hypothetical protein